MKDLIEALLIFSKYNDSEYPTYCEHDVLYIVDINPNDVKHEDLVKLDELGFIAEEEGFLSFKFGSA